MPSKGYIWDEEYRDKYYASPKVQDHLKVFLIAVSRPKSKETKDKMSEAKKDKVFTQEHKDNLAATQRLRHQLRKSIAQAEPNLTSAEQWAKVKEMLKEMK